MDTAAWSIAVAIVSVAIALLSALFAGRAVREARRARQITEFNAEPVWDLDLDWLDPANGVGTDWPVRLRLANRGPTAARSVQVTFPWDPTGATVTGASFDYVDSEPRTWLPGEFWLPMTAGFWDETAWDHLVGNDRRAVEVSWSHPFEEDRRARLNLPLIRDADQAAIRAVYRARQDMTTPSDD